MQCAFCKETIDDDSRYCDQCGEQILVCSVCGRPGKGKRCVFDGKELLPVSSIPAGSGVLQVSKTASVVVQSPQPVQPAPQNVGDKIKLVSQIHNITIEVKDGDIIGSKNGAFADVFGRFKFVSSTHCKFIKTAAGWHIQDVGSNGMGSTNGTYYNGSQLAPNVLYPILSNTTVRIADIELHITYDTGGIARI